MEEKKVEQNEVAQDETKDVSAGDSLDEKKEEVVEEKTDAAEELVKYLDIEVKEADIDKQIEEVARQYSSEVKLPGFRKGKVPVDIVRKRFKQAIADEALNKVVEHAVFEKVKKENLEIVSAPSIKEMDYQEGSDLKAKVAVEVFPEITLPEFDKLEVEIAKSELAPEYDEEKQIDGVLNAHKRRMLVSDREIKDEDIASLKVQAQFVDNRRMTPRKESEFVMNKETNHEISGLYDELLGKKAGDTIEFNRAYPEDYTKKPWAGKELKHMVEILNIFQMVKPELNEEFLKSINVENEEVFKKQLKEEFDRYADQMKEDKVMSLLSAKVVESVDFPLPQSLVAQELERTMGQHLQYLDKENVEQTKQYVQLMQDNARKSVKSMLVFDAIRKEFKVEVSNDDLEAEYKKISEQNNFPVAEIRKFYSNADHKNKLKDNILSRKMVELLKEKISIKEV
jgi:trigger factor